MKFEKEEHEEYFDKTMTVEEILDTNYRRREYEDIDITQDHILEIYKRISEIK